MDAIPFKQRKKSMLMDVYSPCMITCLFLLFIVCKNDLPLVLAHSNAHMFADDTAIPARADSKTQLHEYLSSDFKCVIKSVENNKYMYYKRKKVNMVLIVWQCSS